MSAPDLVRWTRVRALFEELVDLDASARHQRLAAEPDDDVRNQAEAMLAAEEVPCRGDALDRGAPGLERLDPGAPRSLVGRTLGAFRLIGVLGSGGMGTVYEAEQAQPLRRVAVKVLREGLRTARSMARFRYEAELLGRLRHPSIAQVYAAGTHREPDTDSEIPYIAIEFVEGARSFLEDADARSLGRNERLRRFVSVCRAIQHAHGQAVIHRDIKDGNVLVAADGTIKVIDFGIARREGAATRATEPGALVGTLGAMSPEQARGEQVDARTDVYSLGVLLYQLLTGRPPIEVRGRGWTEALLAIEREQPLPIGKVERALRGNVDLQTIVSKALAKAKEQRYESVSDLGGDLERFLQGQPILARRPSALYVTSKFVQRHWVAVGISVAVAVLAVAGAWTVVTQRLELSRVEASQARQAEAAALAKLEATEQRGWADAFDSVLQGIVQRADAYRGDGSDVPLRIALDHISEQLGDPRRGVVEATSAAEPAMDPFEKGHERTARLHVLLGRTYRSLTLLAEAERHLEGAERMLAELGVEQGPTWRSLTSQLAALRRDQGHFRGAIELIETLVAHDVAAFGPDSRKSLDSQHELAVLEYDAGEYARAEQRVRAVLIGRQRVLGVSASDTLRSQQLLGSALVSQGKADEAAGLLEDVVREREQVLGPNHLETARARSALARARADCGDLEEAQRLFEAAFVTYENQLGPDNDRTVATNYQIDGLLMRLYMQSWSRGNPDRTLLTVLLERTGESLPRCRRLFGATHWRTVEQVRMRSFALNGQGRREQATEELRVLHRALVDERGLFERDSVKTANNMASIYIGLKRPDDALAVVEPLVDAYRAFRDGVGADKDEADIRTSASSTDGLQFSLLIAAQALAAKGEHDHADDVLAEAAALTEQAFGPNGPEASTLRAVQQQLEQLRRQ